MVLIHMVVCHPTYSIEITFFEIDLTLQKGELCYAESTRNKQLCLHVLPHNEFRIWFE